MRTEKIIGWLLVIGVTGVCIPYIILTQLFNYPLILRETAGGILERYRQAGTMLIWTWWGFAILCLPLLEAYVLIGQLLEKRFYFIRWATTLGIISGIVQIVGILRWVFVVPVLSVAWSEAKGEAGRAAVETVFLAVHQFGGVLLGEHIGQLFTIAWTIMINAAFGELKIFPRWLILLGYLASFMYLLAQAELFATVIPSFPVWAPAGLVGSSLWLCWLMMVGFMFIKTRLPANAIPDESPAL